MSRRHGLIGASKPCLYKEEDAEFYYRQTSGGVLMNNSPLVGSIDRIKGHTIAWNQLVRTLPSTQTQKGITLTNNGNGSVTINGTNDGTGSSVFGFNLHFALTLNHKYILFGSSAMVGWSTYTLYLNASGFNAHITSADKGAKIFTASVSDASMTLAVWANKTVSNDTFYPMVFDLTLIYGVGNEPSTPEQFEADYFRWFGKPLTYEPYDEGSLRNVQMEGIKSVGFNQWDEEWELGILNDSGQPSTEKNRLRSKNFIPCFGNESYYVYSGSTNSGRLCFYDANYNYISFYNSGLNYIVTTPINARFMKFFIYRNGITTYNNDICINISNTNKNGTYKPYKSDIRNFDVTSITGKLNGEGESVVIFPDGMKGVNDVKDEIFIEDGVTKAIKRVGRVDLGSLTWEKLTGATENDVYFRSSKPTGAKEQSNIAILCSNYEVKIWRSVYRNVSGNYNSNGIGTYNGRLAINDSSYTDVTTFKAAMQGVYLDYELAKPQVYVLDTPLPIAYNCEASGTEQILPEVIGTGIAPIMDIKYKVGNVAEKPWYGIKWSEDNGQMQRIASNMELHATLPIQSNMKRCMLLDNGSVYKYISDTDPFLYEDGTSVKYDGTDGQVMVEVPAYWYTAYKETDENNITWNYLKLYPEGGGQRYSRKIYRGAFEMVTDNSDNSIAKGCSVSMLDFSSMNTTKDTTSFVASNMQYLSAATSYRNWNYANVDATDVKNSLGKPTTNRNRATFRDIAARRGAGFSQEYWDSYNSLIRLYVVEYCNFNIQANINNSLTVEGFKQGGLGAGVTNANLTKWSNFNSYNPFVPCGVTVPLGNKSGAISYAFTNDNFDDVSITYSVPSYRGIENPFGHIWKFIDGFNRKGKVENDVTTEMIYVCDTISKFAENDADGYVLQSDTAPRANGNFGGVDWNAKGTFWPKLGGRTMYSDYFYNSYANNTWYTLYGGGYAYSGSRAGLFSLFARSGSSYANADIGSRLLFTK